MDDESPATKAARALALARADKLTPERRAEIASKAAQARWSSKKRKVKKTTKK